MAASPSLESKAAETLLRHAQLPAETHEALKTQFSQSALLQGAGWHGPSDIKTLVGLEGQFLWPEDVFNVGTIRFSFDLGKIGYEGRYELARGWSVAEKGLFYCVPNNPAIGFAAITLMPDGGEVRSFVVNGMMTDNEWKIYVAVLNKLGPSGPLQPPMSIVRIG
ncbi:MAG TPA: hypothetical protein VFY73_17760 [Ideonella sp.]|uniref:hypothetical protein n=1 Tax=Ideonella sp. TaxID=1929293 RepID=UPI002E2F644D|nr:hypothetical protein [Ideonella sp.]HEX5685874.1 hypothetical protein [Ideonella sp.]